jgi:cytochrome c5
MCAILLFGAMVLSTSFAATASVTSPAPEATRGRAVFERRCGVCHLAGQTGAEILARRLGREKSLLAARTDLVPAYVRLVVRTGLMNMPRISRVEIPDPDLDAIIAYLVRPRTTPEVTP